MLQDVDIDHNIWGTIVPDLNGYITRKKPTPVSGDLVHVTEELVKINKDVYLTAALLFVISNSFFLTLINNIWFTAVNHFSKKNEYHIQVLKIYIQILHEAGAPHHNSSYRWIICPNTSYDLRAHSSSAQDKDY